MLRRYCNFRSNGWLRVSKPFKKMKFGLQIAHFKNNTNFYSTVFFISTYDNNEKCSDCCFRFCYCSAQACTLAAIAISLLIFLLHSRCFAHTAPSLIPLWLVSCTIIFRLLSFPFVEVAVRETEWKLSGFVTWVSSSR